MQSTSAVRKFIFFGCSIRVSLRAALPAALLIFSSAGCNPVAQSAVHSEKGVFDLRAMSLQSLRPIPLEGQWEFYWKALLTPDDFKNKK